VLFIFQPTLAVLFPICSPHMLDNAVMQSIQNVNMVNKTHTTQPGSMNCY